MYKAVKCSLHESRSIYGCICALMTLKHWIKYDMTVQTADSLKTIGYVFNLVPYMEVSQIEFLGSEKLRNRLFRLL